MARFYRRARAHQKKRGRSRPLTGLGGQKIRPLLDRLRLDRGGVAPASRVFHGRSGRKPLAAFGTAASEDLTAVLRREAGAETVAALADELARLIGPFHGRSREVDAWKGGGEPEGPAQARREAGLLDEGACGVKRRQARKSALFTLFFPAPALSFSKPCCRLLVIVRRPNVTCAANRRLLQRRWTVRRAASHAPSLEIPPKRPPESR